MAQTIWSDAADFASNEPVFKPALVGLVSVWKVLGEKCLLQLSLYHLHCIVWCVEGVFVVLRSASILQCALQTCDWKLLHLCTA